jgi:hypothetical protein
LETLNFPAEWPKEYKKGPDVMSKSSRTQRWYQKAFRCQGKLTGFGFKAPNYDPHLQLLSGPGPSSLSKQRDADMVSLNLLDHPVQPPPQASLQDTRKHSASVLSDPSTDHHIHSEDNVLDDQDLGASDEGAKSRIKNRGETLDSELVVDPAEYDEEVEDLEAELEEVVEGPKGHIQDWADLHTNIKNHLKKHSKTLPLSQLNQLMIISNFATLRLKGLSWTQASIEIARQWHEGQGNWFAWCVRALARHYQIFKKLPVEKHGCSGNTHSWLHDESVKKLTLNWLTSENQ